MADNIVGTKIVIDNDQAVQSVGSIKKQLKEATNDLVAMADKFGESSKEAITAAKRVAELRDRIGDAKSMADAFNPDAKFRAVSQSVQGIAGAFAAVQGAMASFGLESEDLQKQLLKIQGALALSEGLNAFLDTGIQGFKNLGSVIKSTFLTLKAEIGATGVGALVIALATAVGLLVDNFDKLNGVTEDAARKNKAYADSLDETNTQAAKAISNVNSVKLAFEDAKNGVISKDEALKIYNDTLGAALGETNNLAVAENNLNSKADDYIKATMLKAQANAMFAASAKLQAESLTADQKDNVSWWQKSISAVNSFFTNGILSYKTSLAAYQAINTQEIKTNLGKQAEVLNTEGAKLLKQSEELQKKAGINLNAKTSKSKGDKKEELGKIEKIDIEPIENKQIDAVQRLNLAYKTLDATRVESTLKNKDLTEINAELAEKMHLEEKARFDESLKWAMDYTQSAQSLSDALYAAKLAGVEKGSKEEEAILRKQFEVNKKLQIAQTLISGFNGIVNALSAKSVFLEPTRSILNGINAAFIGATTAANVAKINQTQFGSTAGAMSSGGYNAGGSAPMSPTIPIQQTVTQLNQGTINALGNQAIKAYVLESDVTNSQGRVTRILNSSRFK